MRGIAKTLERAERCAFTSTDPFVVRFEDGSFDWFPAFYAVPSGAVVVSRHEGGEWIREID